MSDSLVHAASGALGGCIAMAITYPLITLSTRAQVETKHRPGETTLDAARKILKQEGLLGLFDGVKSGILGIAVTNGVYYLFFEETRTFLLRAKKSASNSFPTLTTLESMFASFIAGSATSIISNPIWVINTRQTVRTTVSSPKLPPPVTNSTTSQRSSTTAQAPPDPSKATPYQKKKSLGFIQTFLYILKNDGWQAFFKGLGPALILVINPILQYTLFEQLKNIIVNRRATAAAISAGKPPPKSILAPAVQVPLSDWDYFVLGAVSKLFATGITYPYLTIKSRMQSGQSSKGQGPNGSVGGIRRVIKDEGIGGLYRGIGPKLTQSVLTAAILFMSKEKIYQVTKKAITTAATAAPVAS